MRKENFKGSILEFNKDREPRQDTEIWYAGASPKRSDVLRHIFGNIQTRPGGDEANIEDVMSIMNRKLDTVLPQTLDRSSGINKLGKNQRVAVIAADIRTRISRIGDDGINYMESRGKPKSLEHIRSAFEDMHAAYEQTGVDPNYLVTVGSGVHIMKRKSEERFTHYGTHTIVLDPEMTKYLTTEDGQVDYIDTFYDLYDNLPVNSNGKRFEEDITNVAAGVELPALARMNAIKEIDGTPVTDSQFDSVFRKAVYNLAAGISPDLLKTVNPQIDIHQAIQTWPFLNGVTEFSLGTRAAA